MRLSFPFLALPVSLAVLLMVGRNVGEAQSAGFVARAIAADCCDGRIPIAQGDLPLTIVQPGSYVVTQDLTGSSGQSGITVDADDVTLDLNGFTLRGVAGSVDGISVASGRANLSVRNGTVRDWGNDGIEAKDGVSGSVEGVTVLANAGNGIQTGDDFVVRRCVSRDNGKNGIVLKGADNLIVDNVSDGNNTACAGCAGINVCDASAVNAVVTGNTVSNNNFGIRLAAVTANALVVDNHLSGDAISDEAAPPNSIGQWIDVTASGSFVNTDPTANLGH